MLQVLGIAFATIVCFVFLKDRTPEIALAISIAGALIIFCIALTQLNQISDELNKLLQHIPSSASYVLLMIKVLLIVIITQIVVDICRDSGNNSLASVIEISAKVLIISIIMPMMKSLLSVILGLIK